MFDEKRFVCIECPKGCNLRVYYQNNEIKVDNNGCKRGEIYGISEVTNPTRVITTTVATSFEEFPRLSVKTSKPVNKSEIFSIMEKINKIIVNKKISINEVIIKNIDGNGADLVSTNHF